MDKRKETADSSPKERDTDPNKVRKAHEEADKDIANDPDLNAASPNDDLDEGESARLGEQKTGLV